MEKKLPAKYFDKLLDSTIPGSNSKCWRRVDLLEFLNDKLAKEFVILGGDVIRVDSSGQMEFTYDNWHLDNRLPNESFKQYGMRSIEVTKAYLAKIKDEPDLLFSPVITSEVTAGL